MSVVLKYSVLWILWTGNLLFQKSDKNTDFVLGHMLDFDSFFTICCILLAVLDHLVFCVVKPLVRDCDLFQLSATLSCVLKAVVKHKLGSLEQKDSTQPLCHYLLESSVCACVRVRVQIFSYFFR